MSRMVVICHFLLDSIVIIICTMLQINSCPVYLHCGCVDGMCCGCECDSLSGPEAVPGAELTPVCVKKTMVNKAIPTAHTCACFYNSVCCSLGLRSIKEAVLCVSRWVVINKFFRTLNTREIRRC